MSIEFSLNTARIKFIAKHQMEMDPQFTKEATDLQNKLGLRKITGAEFLEAYKKSLLKSVQKNEKLLQDLFKKTDKEMKEQFKIAEQNKEEPKTVNLKL